MPKHRSTIFTVVREAWEPHVKYWYFSGFVGTYATLSRAEEVAAATIQHYIDAGMDEANAEYRCTVKPSTWYEE